MGEGLVEKQEVGQHVFLFLRGKIGHAWIEEVFVFFFNVCWVKLDKCLEQFKNSFQRFPFACNIIFLCAVKGSYCSSGESMFQF